MVLIWRCDVCGTEYPVEELRKFKGSFEIEAVDWERISPEKVISINSLLFRCPKCGHDEGWTE